MSRGRGKARVGKERVGVRAAVSRVGRAYRVLSVIGTRPEAIKMGPVLRALSMLPILEQEVLLTGQHQGLANGFGDYPRAELDLDLTEHSAGELCEAMRDAICRHLLHGRPDLVLVQGDTASALAGALAARDCGIPVGHVEAGLRSHQDEPWPEERYRVEIDAAATLLFAPTKAAAANLAKEPAVRGTVHVTGNSGVDALLQALTLSQAPATSGRKRILVTVHRRENQGERLQSICAALRRLARDLPVEILFLLHSNPQNGPRIAAELAGVDHITLREAVSHAEMVELMVGSWLFLTDSGGLQEDGPALGRPVLVMRDVTERIEAPNNIRLVGTSADAIFATVHDLLRNEARYIRMATPALPFGDGHAAPRIAAIVADWLTSAPRQAKAS